MGWVIFIVLFVIFCIYSAVKDSKDEKTKQEANSKLLDLKKELDNDLKVKLFESSIETKDGEKLPCHKVTISGTCLVPSQNYPCQIQFYLIDISDSDEDEKLPVLCTIPDLANEHGFFSGHYESKMPYLITSFEDMPVIAFPPEALIMPKRGERKLKIYVAVTEGDSDRIIKAGSATRTYIQKEYGYMEYEQRSIDINSKIARIAIAVSASDGYIDKRETAVIRNYFAEQFARLKDPERIKNEVNNILKTTLVEHKANALDSHVAIESACSELKEAGGKSDAHAAYELAVRIIAADEEVQESERDVLKHLAEILDIPDELAREFQDKHFAVSMFDQSSDEALLDMPSGLDEKEKIQFLNNEYKKWRARVNHKEEKMRTQAELRIQAITRTRKKLENNLQNV